MRAILITPDEANLPPPKGAIAVSSRGVTRVEEHATYRRQVNEQAKSALNVSEQKASMVADQAPTFSAKWMPPRKTAVWIG